MAMIAGYELRKVEFWRQTRLIAYTIACTVTEKDKRGSIYDMFPLPGDPTALQREQTKKDEYEEMLKQQRNFTNEVREEMRRANQNKK